VFGYIRLPPLIATLFPSSFHLNSIIDTISSFSPITDEADRSLVRGLRWTFYIIATIAFCEGTFLYFAFHLPSSLSPVLATNSLDSSADAIVEVKEKISIGVRMKEAVVDLGLGFKIATQEQEAALAYVATFTTRSASLVTSAFIPLLINNVRSIFLTPREGKTTYPPYFHSISLRIIFALFHLRQVLQHVDQLSFYPLLSPVSFN
jgi:hypothetical protein